MTAVAIDVTAVAIDELRELVREQSSQIARLLKMVPREADAPRITVAELAHRYFASQEAKNLRSNAGEEPRFRKNVERLLGDVFVDELTLERLEWYRQQRAGEFGHTRPTRPATRNREIVKLSAMLTWAAKRKIIPANPIRGAAMEAENNLRRTCPKTVDVNAILARADSLRLRAMITTSFCTGLRRAELLAVRLEQVDWEDGLIAMEARQTKGGKRPRITILTAQARALIRQYLDERKADGVDSPFLFCTASGRRISPRNYLRDFQAAAARAGIRGNDGERLCLHDLRSGFVGRQLELGTPQEVIKSMTGHTTDDAFRRYVRVQRSWLLDVRKRTDDSEKGVG